jgi:hypothetical protein
VFWERFIEEHGLEIRNNNRPTHRWTREDDEAEPTIDLTMSNHPITKWTILDCEHTTRSDHELIKWEVVVGNQEEPKQVPIV